MTAAARKRAAEVYREQLVASGLARFEIRAPQGDRELFRSLGRRLSTRGVDAEQLRSRLHEIVGPPGARGRILEALLRAPPELGELDLSREVVAERDTGR